MMKQKILLGLFGFLLCATPRISAGFQSPFDVRVGLQAREQGDSVVRVAFDVPPGHSIYAETLAFEWEEGTPMHVVSKPLTHRKPDPMGDGEKELYDQSFVFLLEARDTNTSFRVAFQGCNQSVCFLPESRVFNLAEPQTPVPPPAPDASRGAPAADAPFPPVKARAAGFMNADEFARFLDRAEGRVGDGPAHGLTLFAERPAEFMRRFGWIWTLVIVLLGGFLLNLTPCVLPMIPVNLAVIGAGVRASSRLRGFGLGAVYGGAIALTYGGLGLMVALTGATFGSLNASPWFNIGVATIFMLLSLAMFGVFSLDFTRFRQRADTGNGLLARGGPWLTAFLMGGLSALLAGACVAPVVLSVLLLAQNLLSAGVWTGLLLPFVLGAGMGLPWPFAGMGLAFLPKPGAWMEKVKYGFGAFILLLALYYGWSGVRGLRPPAETTHTGRGTWEVSLDRNPEEFQKTLDQALLLRRPVLIDFWATWCKNCEAMERTTFKDTTIRRRLADYTILKVQAERPDRSPARAMLETLEVQGFPYFLIVTPSAAPEL